MGSPGEGKGRGVGEWSVSWPGWWLHDDLVLEAELASLSLVTLQCGGRCQLVPEDPLCGLLHLGGAGLVYSSPILDPLTVFTMDPFP